MPDSPYINPAFDDLLGRATCLPGFPSPGDIESLYPSLSSMPADDIVYMITSDPRFNQYRDIISSAISGMHIKGIGYAITKFIDIYFPFVLERLNSNESDLALYRAVVVGIVSNLHGDGLEG